MPPHLINPSSRSPPHPHPAVSGLSQTPSATPQPRLLPRRCFSLFRFARCALRNKLSSCSVGLTTCTSAAPPPISVLPDRRGPWGKIGLVIRNALRINHATPTAYRQIRHSTPDLRNFARSLVAAFCLRLLCSFITMSCIHRGLTT